MSKEPKGDQAGALGEELRQIRALHRLTLRQVEEVTGISNAYLSQLETGKIAQPSPNYLGFAAGRNRKLGYVPTSRKPHPLPAEFREAAARPRTDAAHMEYRDGCAKPPTMRACRLEHGFGARKKEVAAATSGNDLSLAWRTDGFRRTGAVTAP